MYGMNDPSSTLQAGQAGFIPACLRISAARFSDMAFECKP